MINILVKFILAFFLIFFSFATIFYKDFIYSKEHDKKNINEYCKESLGWYDENPSYIGEFKRVFEYCIHEGFKLKKFDLVVIGGGPGGYVAAIRASQLGKKVAVVEKEHLGGICLNWGCIPTKALLKNADILNIVKKSSLYGIDISNYKVDWKKIIKRSRDISSRLSKGIEFLMKKNKIQVFNGIASFIDNESIIIDNKNEKIFADNFIIATGARAASIPGMEPDSKLILSYKEAMILKEIPKTLVIIGAGAIGV